MRHDKTSASNAVHDLTRRSRRSIGTHPRRGVALALAVGAALSWPAVASAQLDGLLFAKRVPPTVIIVVDTSMRMLEDGAGNYYDPTVYSSTADPTVMGAFPNIDPSTMPSYRRMYRNVVYEVSPGRYSVDTIVAVPATGAAAGDAFLEPTRWSIAKRGIAAAVGDNAGGTFRWGLIRLRQRSPAWRVAPNCDKPVRVNDLSQALYSDSTPCNAGLSKFGIYAPSVTAASYAQTAPPGGTIMVTPAPGMGASIVGIANRGSGDNLGFVPAGLSDIGFEDRPIDYALVDARAAAVAAMNADSATTCQCRNTVVILIASGKDDGNSSYASAHDPVATAGSFVSVTGGGVTRRVPIHVIGVKPGSGDEAELQGIASASGGRYTNATSAADVAAAINFAVQAGFSRHTDFDAGRPSEFIPVSPVVGTVNLKDARDASGSPLPNTDIKTNPGDQPIPQRSNMLLTAGFSLPGFDGRLRAFRAYKPEVDPTKPSGWKFVHDNTRLWPDLDGRPQLAGMARVPANPDQRNIFTFVPDGAGGGSVVEFRAANAATLAPHMGSGTHTSALISFVRAQPLGAIIGSTPALMDPPSLDPPPDDDYGRVEAPGTFAGDHRNRRGMIFVGANDGMIHAIDARTGYEVWAFIPYNLLPKLLALGDGQPVEQFDYFVDSSPKIAEVKINGAWRSMLIIGEGQGGTFYQTFDVTNAGMGVDPELDSLSGVSSVLARFDSPNESIEFKWSFPNYSSFNPNYTGIFTVLDGTPGGRVKFFGDLLATATYAEKTVGYAWSDPAVGPITSDRSKNAVIVGSGYFPFVEHLLPGRGPAAPRAGTVLYLIDIETGKLIGNPSGGTCSGTGCLSVGDVASNGRKNALQADPTAAGNSGSFVVNKAYLGDIDGNYWRFNFTGAGTISSSLMIDTGQPIYSSSALLFVGSSDVYMFFSTGSDLLPSSAPGGTGTFKLYGLKDNSPAAGSSTMFSRNLATVSNSGGLATGERPSTAPSVAGDIVFYTTTTESAAAPCSNFTSSLYAVTYKGGAAYDSNSNGRIDNNESPVAKSMTGRATAPFIVDQHLYVGTSGTTGPAVETFGDPEDFNNGVGQVGVRILSWREIR